MLRMEVKRGSDKVKLGASGVRRKETEVEMECSVKHRGCDRGV